MNHQLQPEAQFVQTSGLRTLKTPTPSTGFVLIPGKPKKLRKKRIFDICFSILVIIFLLSWLLPLLALIILVDSRGPVFFIQRRVGAYGRVFRCIKLRTMVVNQEANCMQALKNDPRITPFGKFLRRSCLDELPQFFNVLLGHMSIVGPRPHMLTDCREFSAVVKDYHHRNFVKPGITGMAQVKGYRGKTEGFFDVFHRYKWDMFYVNNCSFSLDMHIIRMTIVSTASSVISAPRMQNEPASQVKFHLDSAEYLN